MKKYNVETANGNRHYKLSYGKAILNSSNQGWFVRREQNSAYEIKPSVKVKKETKKK